MALADPRRGANDARNNIDARANTRRTALPWSRSSDGFDGCTDGCGSRAAKTLQTRAASGRAAQFPAVGQSHFCSYGGFASLRATLYADLRQLRIMCLLVLRRASEAEVLRC